MAFPFSLYGTFIPNSTPVIPAEFLNALDELALATAAALGYGSQKLWAHSYDGGTINVETLHGCIVKDYTLGTYVAPVLPTTPTVLDVNNLVPAAANFASITWYYVYLRSNGRVAEFVISATAPGADLRWKGPADDTYRFLFSFKTTSGQLVDPIVHKDGVTEYVGGEFGVRDEGVSVTSTASWTTIPLTFCPPHARRVLLWARVTNTSAAGGTYEKLRILPKGMGAVTIAPAVSGKIVTGAPGVIETRERLWVETDSTPAVEGKLLTGLVGNEGDVVVAAWEEYR